MGIQLQININKNPAGTPKIKFNPNPLAASVMDQIFWTNNDSEPHWPGLLKDDGTIDTTFFMPNQIAGNGDVSPIFSASSETPAGEPLNYKCSIQGHENETGSITVS